MRPFQPEDFGRYKLERRIAIGGMAEIFAAKYFGAMGFQKSVVLKRILPQFAADTEFLRMFITEAKLVCHLEHPNIVQVYELGEVDGHYYMAMEYVNGIDARQLWRTLAKRKQRLPGVLALFIVSEFVKGLDYAHRAVGPDNELLGVVHRDVSPSNILLSFRGDVKIGDFGIALVQQESTTQAGVLKGKYGYMSPEQVAGLNVDHRSDVFAAGIVLAELILGRRLFLGRSDFETLDKVMNVRLDVLEKHAKALPPELVTIIRRSLQRDPADRYPSAREMHEEIVDFLYQGQDRITNESLAAFVAQHVAPFVTRREGSDTHSSASIGDAPMARPARRASTSPSSPVLPGPITPKLEKEGYETGSQELDVPVIEDDLPPEIEESMIAGEVAVGADTGPAVDPEATVVPSGEVAIDNVQDGVAFEIDASAGADLSITMPPGAGAGEPADLDGSDVLFGHVPADPPDASGGAGDDPDPHLPLWDNVIEPDYQFGAIPELEFESDDHLELDVDHGALTPDTGTEAELDSGLEVNAAHHIRPAEVGVVDRAIISAQLPTVDQEDKPDFAGKLPVRTVAKVLFRFGLAQENGLLVINGPAATGPQAEHLIWIQQLRADLTRKAPPAGDEERSCEIRLEEGQPRRIAADRSEEALVAHLITAGHLERQSIDTALRANPHRGLIAALISAGMLAPLHISRHVTAYVLEMVLDTFGWETGSFSFYRGREPEHDAFPTGMDLMELLHRGVGTIPEPALDRYIQRLGAVSISRAKNPPALLEAFAPNQLLRHLYQLLAGADIAETLKRAAMLGPAVPLKRALYTLVECELATLA